MVDGDGWWLMVDGWWLMVDGWWLMVDGWWLMVDGWWLMVDGWWLMVDGWWLMVDGWWLMVDGWWLMSTRKRQTRHQLLDLPGFCRLIPCAGNGRRLRWQLLRDDQWKKGRPVDASEMFRGFPSHGSTFKSSFFRPDFPFSTIVGPIDDKTMKDPCLNFGYLPYLICLCSAW